MIFCCAKGAAELVAMINFPEWAIVTLDIKGQIGGSFAFARGNAHAYGGKIYKAYGETQFRT